MAASIMLKELGKLLAGHTKTTFGKNVSKLCYDGKIFLNVDVTIISEIVNPICLSPTNAAVQIQYL